MTTMAGWNNQRRNPDLLDFAKRALVDFGLLDAFLARPEQERQATMQWIRAAKTRAQEEDRVSRLLDCLDAGHALPGSLGACFGKASCIEPTKTT